jgi:hypothetical protein
VTIGSGDGWAAPTAGNLIVVGASSDGTVTLTPAGFTAGPAVVDTNAAYAWWKVAAGTETSLTATPNASTDTVFTVAEYSGVTGAPFDAQNSSQIANTAGTTTSATSVTTTAANDLIVVFACLGVLPSPITGLTWANGFVTASSGNTGATSGTFFRQHIDMGERIVTTAALYSTSASWTNEATNRQQLMMAFKESPVVAAAPKGRASVENRNAVLRASRW